MSLLNKLSQPDVWESFYKYKTSVTENKAFCKKLYDFISSKGYIPVCERIMRGERFPLPRKSVISKTDTQKKRIVYIYPEAENMVLKLLTYLLIRKYDYHFSDNLYSFRPIKTAKDAVRRFASYTAVSEMYSYKADISNYFNSVPTEKMLPLLKEILSDDEQLFDFLSSLLKEPYVIEGSSIITENKGIMAGTPLSAFYANLYLSELDRCFESKGLLYGRYSDDIIFFAKSEEYRDEMAEFLRSFIFRQGLSINPSKECLTSPHEMWTFLGFSYKDGIIDIAPVSVKKLKSKMRRKTRALHRWSTRSNLSGEKAALAFIRIFNRKLFECSEDKDLTWSRWYFSVINTDSSLRIIDNYAQDCLRFLISGKHTKSRFNVRYEDLKNSGLRSLVHEYYLKKQQ